ncbi:MAG: hypothetical protein R3E75_08215 [Steroidobacteraceae bacterium]|nr:hypothetical protein [Nevskiaceae bacterium]MCP5472283.1 hypothetical protein [Nevskiaceae bacterium]
MTAPVALRPGKTRRVLAALVEGRRLDRFAAEELGDHTLNTTVSVLQIRHGIHVQREVVKARNAYGPFWHCRYWLDEVNAARARQLLAERHVG